MHYRTIALATWMTAHGFGCGGTTEASTASGGQQGASAPAAADESSGERVFTADVDAIEIVLDSYPPFLTDNPACATQRERERLDVRTWTIEATCCVVERSSPTPVDAGPPAGVRTHEEHRTAVVPEDQRGGIQTALDALREVRLDPRECSFDGQRLYLTVEARGTKRGDYTDTVQCGGSTSRYVTSLVALRELLIAAANLPVEVHLPYH